MPQQPVLESAILHHFRVAVQPWCWCVLPQGPWGHAAGVCHAAQGSRCSLATGTPVPAVSSHTDMYGTGLCFEIYTWNLKTRFQRYQREALGLVCKGLYCFIVPCVHTNAGVSAWCFCFIQTPPQDLWKYFTVLSCTVCTFAITRKQSINYCFIWRWETAISSWYYSWKKNTYQY